MEGEYKGLFRNSLGYPGIRISFKYRYLIITK